MSLFGMFSPPDREQAIKNQTKFLERAQTFITIGVDKDGCIGMAGHLDSIPQMKNLLFYVEEHFAHHLKQMMTQHPSHDGTAFFKVDKDVEIVDFKPKIIGGDT